MDPDLNPFTPGSGRKPPWLAGRDEQVEYFDRVVARSKLGRVDRGLILSGLRGVGKTALLNDLFAHAQRHQWLTVAIEAQPTVTGRASVREQLGREINAGLRKFSWKHKVGDAIEPLSKIVRGFSIAASVGPVSVEIDRTAPASSGEIDIDLQELVETIIELVGRKKSAFGIFIDEMQDLDAELLSALITVQHRASQRDWPFYIIGAGLPNLPPTLAASRSYAERLFTYYRVGPLDNEATSAALRKPAQEHGGRFTEEALELLVEASDGYPYFIQEFGSAIWDLADATPFTRADAVAAVDAGIAHLDAGFFPSRWERATPAERRYLVAMARSGETAPSTAAVAGVQGGDQRSMSTVRKELIAKGLVYMPERGRIAFTVPGMADFIHRQDIEEF